MKGYIYKWENKNNGKVYIGQTMNRYGYKERWSQHKYQAKNNVYNNHFHHAIRKYGVDGFDKQVLETIESDNKSELKNILDELEVEYIKKYDSFNNGYNSTIGGEFNIFNSGDEYDKEKVILNQKSTRARNQIYKSIEIKTKYSLPDSVESLNNLYDEWDIRCCKYRYEYAHKKHWRSKYRHKNVGKMLLDRHMDVYSLDHIGYGCIDNIRREENDLVSLDIDMFDSEVVKRLICIPVEDRYKYGDVRFDMNYIDGLIENVSCDRQIDILDMIRSGFTQQFIADTLGCSRSVIIKQLDKIVRKIIDTYENEYAEKYYYLNVVKGKYKTCSKCGEVKLLQRFNKNSRRRDGYESFCKCCN